MLSQTLVDVDFSEETMRSKETEDKSKSTSDGLDQPRERIEEESLIAEVLEWRGDKSLTTIEHLEESMRESKIYVYRNDLENDKSFYEFGKLQARPPAPRYPCACCGIRWTLEM